MRLSSTAALFGCVSLLGLLMGCGASTGADLGAAPGRAVDAGMVIRPSPPDGGRITDARTPDLDAAGAAPTSCDACPDRCVLGACAEDRCAEPTHPTVARSYGAFGTISDLALADDALFVADRQAGLVWLDASHPPDLRVVTTFPVTGLFSVAAANGYVYALDSEGTLHTLQMVGDALEERSSVPVWGSHIDLLGDELFISGGDRVEMLDRSDPAHPVLRQELPIPTLASGSADHSRGVVRSGNVLYVGLASGGFVVVDASGSSWSVIETRRTEELTNTIALVGGQLVRGGSSGLETYAIDDPRRPRSVQRLDASAIGQVQAMADVSGEPLAANQAGLALLSGDATRQYGLRGHVNDVVVSGRWAFVGTSDAGLHVVDLEANGLAAVRLPLSSGLALALAQADGRLYIAKGEDGVEAWRLSALPSVDRVLTSGAPAYDVAVEGNVVYVSQGTAVSLRRTSDLTELGRIPIPSLSGRVETRIDSLAVKDGLVAITAKALTDALLLIRRRP